MALVDKSAPQLVVPPTMEFFKTLPTDMSVQETEVISFNPTTMFNPLAGTYTFDVPALVDECWDLDKTGLGMEMQIQRENGDPLTADDQVGFENNGVDSALATVQVELNGEVVAIDTHYPQKAHAEKVLTLGIDAANSHAVSSLYVKDTAGNMNAFYHSEAQIRTAALAISTQWLETNPVPAQAGVPATAIHYAQAAQHGIDTIKSRLNLGLQKRAKYTADNQIVWGYTKPASDIFNTGKLTVNGVSIRITITRTKPELMLHAIQTHTPPRKYRVYIHSIKLYLTKVKIFPTLFMGQNRNMLRKPARYNIKRTVVKPITVPVQTTSFIMDNITVGQLPKRIVLGFISNAAYDGDYTENPFNYQNLNVQRLALFVNGKSYPSTAYTPRFGGNNAEYSREYNDLLKVLGVDGDEGIDITRDDYPNGYCLYAFDLSPNKSSSGRGPLTLKKTGNTRLEFQLGTSTGQTTYVCMVFAEYDNIMKIDGDRNVWVNYSM